MDLCPGLGLPGDGGGHDDQPYGYVFRRNALIVIWPLDRGRSGTILPGQDFDRATNHPRGQPMSEPEQSEKQRNREIAANESERQVRGAVRVSAWAIGIAIVLGLIGLGIVWPWLHR